MIILACIYDFNTKRSAILPPRLFKTRTTAILLISVFLHAIVFFTASYYLPLYFQVLGSSATGAGVRIIPITVGSALCAIVSGQAVTRLGRTRPVMWFGWSIMTLGFGLMTMLDDTSNTAEKVLYLFVSALGIGCLFQTPLIALQAAMPLKDMATSTGVFVFMRSVGATIGISIGQTVISSFLKQKVKHIQGLNFDTSPAALSQAVKSLKDIPDPTLRREVIHAYSTSISTVWIVMTPIAGIGFIMVLFLRPYTLKRTVIHAGDKAGDVEAGPVETEVEEANEKATRTEEGGNSQSTNQEKSDEEKGPIQDT